MILLVIAGAIVLTLLFLAWARRTAPSLSTTADIQQGMAELAPEAIAHAKARYDLTLDYTRESIERAEVALGRVHDEIGGGALSPEQGQTLAIRYGAYVGE